MSHIDKLINLIKQHSIAALNTIVITKVGIISTYDPNSYTANVAILPDAGLFNGQNPTAPPGLIAQNCPILTPWLGNGWGFYAPPSPNDMVLVLFLEGNFSSGFVVGNIFNTVDMPINPGPASGEFWLVHQTGTFIKMSNDGTINITALDSNMNPANINVNGNIVLTGNLTLQGAGVGNITATGDILDNSGTNTDNMKGMRTIFNEHYHGNVSVGSANTGPPNVDM